MVVLNPSVELIVTLLPSFLYVTSCEAAMPAAVAVIVDAVNSMVSGQPSALDGARLHFPRIGFPPKQLVKARPENTRSPRREIRTFVMNIDSLPCYGGRVSWLLCGGT
jgi:hypothetical protein